MKKISISDAKTLAQKVEADGIIIISIKDGLVAGASYGKDRKHCACYGKLLDSLVEDRIYLEDITP